MTRGDATEPEYRSFGDAEDVAARQAKIIDEPMTIVAEIARGGLGFFVMLSSSYAQLREERKHLTIAPVGTVFPNGRVEIYSPLKELKDHV